MSHIDDPCDANDEWEKRARRAMAWFTLRSYQRETVEALTRGDRIVLDPKRRYTFMSGTGGYTDTSEENSRRYARLNGKGDDRDD